MTETLNSNIIFSLTEMYKWFSNNLPKPTPRIKEKPVKGKAVKAHTNMFSKKVKKTTALILVVLLFPFVMLAVSASLSFLGYKEFIGGQDGNAKNIFLTAQVFSVASEKESAVLGGVPALGLVYKETGFASSFLYKSEELSVVLMPLVRDVSQLFGNVLGKNTYDLEGLSSKISLEISTVHDSVQALQTLTEGGLSSNIILAKKISLNINFNKFVR